MYINILVNQINQIYIAEHKSSENTESYKDLKDKLVEAEKDVHLLSEKLESKEQSLKESKKDNIELVMTKRQLEIRIDDMTKLLNKLGHDLNKFDNKDNDIQLLTQLRHDLNMKIDEYAKIHSRCRDVDSNYTTIRQDEFNGSDTAQFASLDYDRPYDDPTSTIRSDAEGTVIILRQTIRQLETENDALRMQNIRLKDKIRNLETEILGLEDQLNDKEMISSHFYKKNVLNEKENAHNFMNSFVSKTPKGKLLNIIKFMIK